MVRFAFLFLILLGGSCQSDPEETTLANVLPVIDSVTSLSLQALPLFEEEAGHFSIYFPSPPQRSTHTSEVDIGPLKMTQWVAKDASGQFYVVSYADYPAAVLRLGSEKQLLKGVEERLLSALHAKRTSRHPLLLDSLHQGIAFQAEAKRRHWHLNYQLYLRDKRLYQLGIHSAIGPIHPQDSADFFGSFVVLE
ncbi:MAG: hypothetical protein ACRBFS_18715 [Aureispira sp.]